MDLQISQTETEPLFNLYGDYGKYLAVYNSLNLIRVVSYDTTLDSREWQHNDCYFTQHAADKRSNRSFAVIPPSNGGAVLAFLLADDL